MFLPFRNAEIISAVSSALSQKCSGSSYPYIRNGFFKLSVIQEVSNITQIALRKLRNKNTIFLSYHQTFSSRFFEFLSSSLGFSFCPELSNYRILSSHGISQTVTDFLFFFFSCPEFSNYRISITRNIADSHGFSFLLFLSRIIELSNFIFLVPRLVLCPETCPLSRIIEFSNFCLP